MKKISLTNKNNGKTMENVINYRDIKLVITDKKRKRLAQNPITIHIKNSPNI